MVDYSSPSTFTRYVPILARVIVGRREREERQKRELDEQQQQEQQQQEQQREQ